MVTTIPRHDYPTDNAAEGLEVLNENAAWVLGELGEPDGVGRARALGTTLALAKSYCLVDPGATRFDTWEAWVTAMQTGSALFEAATADEGSTVTVRIKEREHTLPALRPETPVNAGAWITSFYLAMICRDNNRLGRLARVPVSLLRDSGAVFEEYTYAWVETLQSFWLGRQDVGEKLVAAVDGTAPEATQNPDKDLVSKISYPPMILLYRVIRRDPAEFNAALSDALRWHKEYWTADEARADSAQGLVALGPLAMACLAHDQGITVDVESAYLPEALLKHAWAGEIDH